MRCNSLMLREGVCCRLRLRLLMGMLKMENRESGNREVKRNYILTAPWRTHHGLHCLGLSQRKAVGVKGGMLRRRLIRWLRAKEGRESTAVASAGRRRNSDDFRVVARTPTRHHGSKVVRTMLTSLKLLQSNQRMVYAVTTIRTEIKV